MAASAVARQAHAPAAPAHDAHPALQATGLGRRGLLQPTDVMLRRGEVVGVGGLLVPLSAQATVRVDRHHGPGNLMESRSKKRMFQIRRCLLDAANRMKL